MDTFFGRFKNEMFYGYYSLFNKFPEAINKYINYYNNKRIQAKIK
jgi:putative transposase